MSDQPNSGRDETGAGDGDGEPARPRRRFWLPLAALVVVAWLVAGAPLGSAVGKLSDVQQNDSSTFLPTSAESTEAQRLAARFTAPDVIPAVVVYESSGPLDAGDRADVLSDVGYFRGIDQRRGPVIGPLVSDDRRAAEVVVPLDSTRDVAAAVAKLRDRSTGHQGLTAHVAGPAGLTADLVESFAGIDTTLLLVSGAVVLVILVVVYRSVLLPIIVLSTSLLALSLAGAVVYLLARDDVVELNGQSQGILFILVIGACTDYSLLLVSRYREELRSRADRLDALRAAYRAAVQPIVASGGTVILGVLCLLFTDLKSTRSLGPVAALGIGASLIATLTFLPAVLALTGRSSFWPVRPRYGTAGSRGVWDRVARAVGRRPRAIWIAVTAALLALGIGLAPGFQASGTRQTEVFLNTQDSVVGQQVLADHFPAGAGSPVQVVTRATRAEDVVTALRSVDGVVPETVSTFPPRAPQPKVVDGRVLVEATLADEPDSAAAVDTIGAIRAKVHGIAGADAKVGGETAVQADTRSTSERDRTLVIPIVLAVIMLILVLLLRAIVAAVMLVATVVLSFAATLGVAAAVFYQILDFPGADPAVPLFAFVFLVALGVDYNIFLMSRVREEAVRTDTRAGTLEGLRATGGVITSAGVVLAATFATLSVIPLLFLVQIAFLVAFGVLLDTLVVRALLVPAVVLDLDRFTWWPSRLARRDRRG